MSALPRGDAAAAPSAFLDAYGDVAAAVESGAGLSDVARAAARALNASVLIVDEQGQKLADSAESPDEEHVLERGVDGTETVELRMAEAPLGRLHYRVRGTPPPPALRRMVATLLALEVERSRRPGGAGLEAVATFLAAVFDGKLTAPDQILACGSELGAELEFGACVLVVRARPLAPEEGDWRARVLTVAERAAREVEPTALTALVDLAGGFGSGARFRPPASGRRAGGRGSELMILVPGDGPTGKEAAATVLRELEARLPGIAFVVACSRQAAGPANLRRSGAEAVLTGNVAEAQGRSALAFEETGAYRLLLPAVSEDPAELQRLHEETVGPLLLYDAEYETQLLRTLESFLDADGSVAKAAQELATHRHTVRYRLERVRELTGLDASSTDGRERLGLGLKAMRVLGIAPPQGPAGEPGTEGGRTGRGARDR